MNTLTLNTLNTLHTLTVVNSEAVYCFYYVEFESGKTLQCCLNAQNQICRSDMGCSEGISMEVNSWAVLDGEWSAVESFLIERAIADGVEIV